MNISSIFVVFLENTNCKRMKITNPFLNCLFFDQFFVKPSLQNGYNHEFILIMKLQKLFQLIVKTPNLQESRVKSNYFEPTCKKKHGQRTKSPMHRKPYNRGDLFRKYVKSLRTEIIKGGQGKQRLALADSCTTPRTTNTWWLNP